MGNANECLGWATCLRRIREGSSTKILKLCNYLINKRKINSLLCVRASMLQNRISVRNMHARTRGIVFAPYFVIPFSLSNCSEVVAFDVLPSYGHNDHKRLTSVITFYLHN